MAARSKEHAAWLAMRYRCVDPARASSYRDRGIRVCRAWDKNFDRFLRDVGPAPSPAHWLDRINNDQGYKPGNVRWATVKEQTRNRRTNRLVTLGNITAPVVTWAERVNIPASAIYCRLYRGWNARRTLTTPLRVTRRPEMVTP